MTRFLLAAVLAAASTTVLAAPDLPPGVRLIDGRVPRFDQKRDMDQRYGHQLDELRRQIIERGERGQNLPCSSQILDETDWLIGSTNDGARVERRLADLRESLKRSPDQQASADRQTASDGSWGECYEAWFLRMQSAVDQLKILADRNEKPRYPLAFMREVDSPAKIVEHFRRMKVSRVLEDGNDYRKELNLTVAALGQLLFLPQFAQFFPPDWPRKAVADALIEFMDKEWQNPETGYWGAWYKIGDRVIKTDDLSITFHIASYRGGRIEHLPEMVRTTFLTRDRAYPFGWQDRGTQNCHHAYDVVRIVRLGWPLMSDKQKAFARAQIVIILARTLRLSVNDAGEVDARPYNRVGEAYYFCSSLLDDIGFFRRSQNFWSPLDFEQANGLRLRMLKQLDSLPQDDPMVAAARRKLVLTD